MTLKKTMVELFAGVGGFRLGMDRLQSGWETVWFSQWEPGKTKQWAHDCYVGHYGDLPDLNNEMTTCQDYSVAHPLSSSQGIEGKKGVLWWQIRDILIAKRPPFVLLENVDRLLKSPASQRGRDFGIILTCFAQLGYRVEWRVVNAADYGSVQRRRRIFIFAYNRNTAYAVKMDDYLSESITTVPVADLTNEDPDMILTEGTEQSDNDLIEITQHFAFDFKNAGFMKDGVVTTCEIVPAHKELVPLISILEKNVDEKYYIPSDKMDKWVYLKGAKKIQRTSKSGHMYTFSEGPIAFPDPFDRPGRTMLTSESTLNRSTHVVADPGSGRIRLLTPIEAERMQGFDDNWTGNTKMPERFRYFCMGNALVVPMITRMGKILDKIIIDEE